MLTQLTDACSVRSGGKNVRRSNVTGFGSAASMQRASRGALVSTAVSMKPSYSPYFKQLMGNQNNYVAYTS